MSTVLEKSLAGSYVPLPAQEAFHRSASKNRLYSGGFGSGKSKCGCIESIYHALIYPGSRGLISRLRMRDLELTTMKTFFQELEDRDLNNRNYVKSYNQKKQELVFQNGSEIIFSGLDDEMKLRSMELAWAYVDEGSEVPETIYLALLGRVRYGRPRRIWVTTNPGASGWLRKNFVDHAGRKRNFFWVNASTYDNIHLPPDYITQMEEEYDPIWVKKYLEGDWDAFEGQVFTGLNKSIHQIKIWKPTGDWEIYEGWDFGYTNPTHITWTAFHPGQEWPRVTFAELERTKTQPELIAEEVFAMRKYYGMEHNNLYSYGDPSYRSVQGVSGKSYEDIYSELGIYITASVKSPEIRALDLMRGFNGFIETRDGVQRRHLITENCVATWRSLINYRYKERQSNQDEDQPEMYLKKDDHGVDSLGYGCAPMNLEIDQSWGKSRRGALPVIKSYSITVDDEPEFPEYDDYSTSYVHGIPI